MRTVVLLTMTLTLTGCAQFPVFDLPTIGGGRRQVFAPHSSTQKLKARCEKKDGKLHVTVQQPAASAPRAAVAPMAAGVYGGAMMPMAAPGVRMIPPRTHHGLTLGWLRLPIPLPRIQRFQSPATMAVQQPDGLFGGLAATPFGNNSYACQAPIMPAAYAPNMMNPYAAMQQQAAMQQMMCQMQRAAREQQARSCGANDSQHAHDASDDADKASELENRARKLEGRLDELLDALDNEQSSTDSLPAPGHSSPIEQTSGQRIRRSHSDYRGANLEMWPYSPQRR